MTSTARFRFHPNPRFRFARALSIALLVAAVGTAVYRLLAPFAAPWLAHRALERLATSTGQWAARADRIDFEPFALAFVLHDVQLSTSDGGVFAGATFARFDFSLGSLISARPVLDRVDIEDGTAQRTSRGASAFWSLFQAFATDARITALEASVSETAPSPPQSAEPPANIEVRGTGLDFGEGRGQLRITVSNPLGDGSRLEAQLAIEPGETGPRLRGTATLARAELALGDWTVAAPATAISVDANLTRSPAASFGLLGGAIAAIDAANSNARFELAAGSANTSWEPIAGLRLQASASLVHGGLGQLSLTRGDGAFQSRAQWISVPATSFAPYIARALGAEPASGTIDLDLVMGSRDPSVANSARLTAQRLRLAAHHPGAATAIALLEGPDGDISIDVMLSTERRAAEHIIEQLRLRAEGISMAPFEALAALVGRDTEDLSAIEFVPGTAEPTPRGQEALATLAAALGLRKRVGLRIQANERDDIDRAALARAQVALHVALATARAEGAHARGEIDFASQRAQDVLDEFGRERLGAGALEDIATSVAIGAAASSATGERVAYYRALFEALVAQEPISDFAMRRLAGFRARMVVQQFGEMGVAATRVVTRDTVRLANEDVLVALPLALEPAPVPGRNPP